MRKKTIWDADEAIRRACPVGMEDGAKLTIKFVVGFERFNNRPYHCYENWCGGYRISGPIGPVGKDWPESKTITVEREDLDDALHWWIKQRDEAKASFLSGLGV